MWEGTTSRVTAADRPYDEFYDFYSVSPENFGSTLVFLSKLHSWVYALMIATCQPKHVGVTFIWIYTRWNRILAVIAMVFVSPLTIYEVV
jgi:hypothetical protein